MFGRAALVLGLLNGLGFIFQFVGMTMTSATNAVLIINLNVVTTAILSSRFLGERLGGGKYLALVVGGAGVVLLTTEGELSSISSGALYGDFLVFLGGLIWSGFIVVQKMSVPESAHAVAQQVFGVTVITCIVTGVPALLFGKLSPIDVPTWAIILYLAIFASAIPYYLSIYALRTISATVSAIILLLQIFFGVALAWLILGEAMSVVSFVGGALIVVAVMLVSFDVRGVKS